MNEELTLDYAGQFSNMQQRSVLPRWQLDMRPEIEEFKTQMLGLEINPNYGRELPNGLLDYRQFVPVLGASITNQLGATQITNKLSVELTKIQSDSNFDTDVIGKELTAFDIDFSFWLAVNFEKFDISPENYNSLRESAVRVVKSAWYRSKGGWKGDLINNNTQMREVIQNNEMVQQQKKPVLGMFGGR